MSCFKCKMCGGDLIVTEGNKIAECEYCGSKQTVPDAKDEKRVNLYNRANRLRMASEFDKAGTIYEQIIAEFPEEAEAYWGLCLCNYGIEYVDDPATAVKIPTCHRASFDKLRKDSNYELCLEYTDALTRTIYEDQAREIDRVMGEILAVSRDEQPYDIFICYKETANSGARTPDSVLAQDIYDALTQKGYRVFFSRITLEDKLGSKYEPYIFSALHSAKIMLVVGTDYEYMNAVWVKNEWSRFIKLMAKDKTKVLIPCYKDMDPYDMPDELKSFQSQDCGKLGFMQDLLRGIDKLFGRDRQVETQNTAISQPSGSATVGSLLQRAFIFLEDGKWSEADEYCERVLDIDPKNAEAYLGKLMAELQVKTREQLAECEEPFDDRDNYQKVVRFGSEKLGAEVKNYITIIIERNENDRLTEIYNKALIAMQGAKSGQAYKAAADMFQMIRGFKDADTLAKQCLDKEEIIRKDKAYSSALYAIETTNPSRVNYETAIELFKSIPGWKDADSQRLFCEKKLEEINAYEFKISQTADAIKDAFERKKWKETSLKLESEQQKSQSEISRLSELSVNVEKKERILKADIAEIESNTNDINNLRNKRGLLGTFAVREKKVIDYQIDKLTEKNKELYKHAQELKLELNNHPSSTSIYVQIRTLQSQIETLERESHKTMPESIYSWVQAIEALNDTIIKAEFKKRYESLYNEMILKSQFAKPGDTFAFGAYPQDRNERDRTPILWKVLEKKDSKIFVISEKAIDCQQYNSSYAKVTWATCSLRTWLNTVFYNQAFNTNERVHIQLTEVLSDENPKFATNCGFITSDKIFLLSAKESEYYFTSDDDRKCVVTEYAIAKGAYTNNSYKKDNNSTCWWWLRTSGANSDKAAGVYFSGSINCSGDDVGYDRNCVRPAMWLSIDE